MAIRKAIKRLLSFRQRAQEREYLRGERTWQVWQFHLAHELEDTEGCRERMSRIRSLNQQLQELS